MSLVQTHSDSVWLTRTRATKFRRAPDVYSSRQEGYSEQRGLDLAGKPNPYLL